MMLSAAVGFAACIHSGLWANIIDIAPRHAGVLLGISNTFASLPGIAGQVRSSGSGCGVHVFSFKTNTCTHARTYTPQVITGYILNHTHSWSLVFGQAVILYLVGFVVYFSWAKGTTQFP